MSNSAEDSHDLINLNDDIEESKVQRRRKRNVSEWNREKRKRLRVAGKEYVNTRGELIRRREIGADCKCRRKCYTKVNSKERERLFEEYYSLVSHDEQNAHLFGLIGKHEIARRRSKGSEKRTCTYKYFVRLKNEREIRVCRQAFCHIHAISAHKVRLLCEKLDRNVSYPRDERGRHSNRPTRIPDGIISVVKKHVLIILQSDRLRDFIKDDKQAKNLTGSDIINITKMWRDFLNEHKKVSSNDIGDEKVDNELFGTSVKLWLYNKIFHSVISQDISDMLRERIDDIKNKKGEEIESRSDIKLNSTSVKGESDFLPRNLVESLGLNSHRTCLSSLQTGIQNSVGVQRVYTLDQSSFSLSGIAGTLNNNKAQCYRS